MCEFYVADALDVQGGALKGRRFDTVLDSACLQVRANIQTVYNAISHRTQRQNSAWPVQAAAEISGF
jgi:hypothetical protein